jgi:hypothetical protein
VTEAKIWETSWNILDYAELIVARIKERYRDVVCLINGEVYGDEDVDIEIYVPEEKLLEVERFAHEVALKETEGTEWFILPSVAPLESCPVKGV